MVFKHFLYSLKTIQVICMSCKKYIFSVTYAVRRGGDPRSYLETANICKPKLTGQNVKS